MKFVYYINKKLFFFLFFTGISMDVLFYTRKNPINLLDISNHKELINDQKDYFYKEEYEDRRKLKDKITVKIYFKGTYDKNKNVFVISDFEITPKQIVLPRAKVGISGYDEYYSDLLHSGFFEYETDYVNSYFVEIETCLMSFFGLLESEVFKNVKFIFKDDFMVHVLFRVFGFQHLMSNNVIMEMGYGYKCLEAQSHKTFEDVVYIDPHEPSDDLIDEICSSKDNYDNYKDYFYGIGITGVDLFGIGKIDKLNYMENFLRSKYDFNDMYLSYITNKIKVSGYFLSTGNLGQVIFKVEGISGNYKIFHGFKSRDVLICDLDIKINEKKDNDFVKDLFTVLSKKWNERKIILEPNNIYNYGLIADCIGVYNILLSSDTYTKLINWMKKQINIQLNEYRRFKKENSAYGLPLDDISIEPKDKSYTTFSFYGSNDTIEASGELIFIKSKCPPLFKLEKLYRRS